MIKLIRRYYEGRLNKLNAELISLDRQYKAYDFMLNSCYSEMVADRLAEVVEEHDSLVEKQNRLVAKLKG